MARPRRGARPDVGGWPDIQLAGGISGCERIESRVRGGPLYRELTFDYHPHVTIAQDVPEEAPQRGFDALATLAATFEVGGFTLYREGRDAGLAAAAGAFVRIAEARAAEPEAVPAADGRLPLERGRRTAAPIAATGR